MIQPLLSIYTKEMKTGSWRDLCTPVFIAALFTTVKTWKQPKCPESPQLSQGKLCLVNKTWGHYAKWNQADRKRNTVWYHVYAKSRESWLR